MIHDVGGGLLNERRNVRATENRRDKIGTMLAILMPFGSPGNVRAIYRKSFEAMLLHHDCPVVTLVSV